MAVLDRTELEQKYIELAEENKVFILHVLTVSTTSHFFILDDNSTKVIGLSAKKKYIYI